jgi:hypothetical protein
VDIATGLPVSGIHATSHFVGSKLKTVASTKQNQRQNMKKHILFGTLTFLAGSLLAADADPKDDVTTAARKLADKDNYAWKRATEDAGGGRSGGTPSEGKIEKDGYLWLSMTFVTPRLSPDAPPGMRANPIEGIKKSEKVAIKTEDGWQSFSEATSGGFGPASIAARLVQAFKAPAAEAADFADKAQELKKDGDAYSGQLTEEVAKSQIITGSGRGLGGPNAPQITDAKGSVKFWVQDGVLTRYQIKVQAKMSIMGNQRDVNRTITVEIKDVGSTKVQVPEDAMKKIS